MSEGPRGERPTTTPNADPPAAPGSLGTPGVGPAATPAVDLAPGAVAGATVSRDDREAYTLPPDARPVVTEIRARRETLTLDAGARGERWTVRVEVPEVWDVVRLDVPATTTVVAVKQAALTALLSGTADPDGYVVKVDGLTVLDEGATLAVAGAKDGGIFLVTHRRRRALR